MVGGCEWTPGCDFDAELLAASGGDEVVVLPTAAAYEHPERRVLAAADWFEGLGARVEGLMVVSRADAEDPGMAEVLRRARFIYLCGGSSLHLRSVLKGSAVFRGLAAAFDAGAVVAGSAAGGTVLTDPMVDPRGGALTVGLGLVGRPGRDPQLRRRRGGRPRREAAPLGGPGPEGPGRGGHPRPHGPDP